MNRLAGQHSAYLKHAAHQNIHWYPWSEEAFEAARREDKPVFLSSGAVWCHWCHVMARESFEDEAIAILLNESFICIKLDRDERPDIDRRYQQAVAAMGGGSGWPLSVFLTPEKKPFFGGTYFPPEDRQGRAGFRKVLIAVSDFFRTRRADAAAYAASVMDALQPERLLPEELEEGFLARAETEALSLYDEQNGGFGTSPKFPMPGAVEFLLRRYSLQGSREAGDAARKTLLAMARGGFHDQLGGGFHRYSVDDAWIIPHFEKMADDNAGLLRNFADAYALFGEDAFRDVAQGIIGFVNRELADPEGGFFASQDADVTPEDEGGYFTWSEAELSEVLGPREYEIIARHLFHPRGVMHHDPSRRVLAVTATDAEIAEALGMPREAVAAAIARARAALLAKRKTREAPFIDRTLYTSLNGMMIAAYFRAFLALGEETLRDRAVLGLDRVLRERWADGTLEHSPGVKGLLDDHVHLVDALLAGYEATGDRRHLKLAETIMAGAREKFLDREAGGFFDTEEDVLGTRMKRIEDVPHASANAVAVEVLLKLSLITGKDEYLREAGRGLRVFAGTARSLGVHGGTYLCALSGYFHQATLTIESSATSALAKEARTAAVRSFSTVRYGPDNGRVIPCLGGACLAPFTGAADLAAWHSAPAETPSPS
jgi:hypothetical protein